jgi:hypothetical protein
MFLDRKSQFGENPMKIIGMDSKEQLYYILEDDPFSIYQINSQGYTKIIRDNSW